MIDFLSASSERIDAVSAFTPPSPEGTVSFWFIPNTGGSGQTLFRNDLEYRVRTGSGNTIRVNLLKQSSMPHISTFTFTTGVLYHFACPYIDNGADTDTDIYIDGVFDSTDNANDGVPTDTQLRIGAGGSSGSPANFFNGEIGDFRVYDRRLSADEIATLYELRGADGIVHGMVNRYLMEEGAEGVAVAGAGAVKDLIGGNNMTPTNTPTWEGSTLRKRRAA